jgi:hypothetical protein
MSSYLFVDNTPFWALAKAGLLDQLLPQTAAEFLSLRMKSSENFKGKADRARRSRCSGSKLTSLILVWYCFQRMCSRIPH